MGRGSAPHLTPYFAYAAAALIAAAHIGVGLLLKVKSTGVVFRTADQVAIAVLGLVIAAGCCCSRGRGCASAPRGCRCAICWATG
ncbi:hypothetical protein I553_10074 [Mycobacterium xenopi 4042]|uniref:Uncharacterized protein n=1 Tax=Mycobacterium xenopi 4042 TaxID=1299334 RepID=X7YP68_MYCXE|nr:hypothetical protein I553_10074 [Mycobacterium xenopi 4042]